MIQSGYFGRTGTGSWSQIMGHCCWYPGSLHCRIICALGLYSISTSQWIIVITPHHTARWINIQRVHDPSIQKIIGNHDIEYARKNIYLRTVGVEKCKPISCLLKFSKTHAMMTSSNGNIFRVTDPLCGEFTSHRWIPLTKTSDAELWFFLWSAPE